MQSFSAEYTHIGKFVNKFTKKKLQLVKLIKLKT